MDGVNHLPILPILISLAGVIVNLVLGDHRRGRHTFAVNLVISSLGLCAAIVLFSALARGGAIAAWSYPLGAWPVPFGIVLVADRLAATMVLTTAILSLAALLYASARWHSRGSHFFTLFHALTMGLNGAFLTGDLFNLFVFFELLLAASYGLALYGAGRNRVRAAMHYIVVNLVASSLFLIGMALIYGTIGTLNMADIARAVPLMREGDRGLFEAGAAVLGVAFLIKAGSWPLHFWLPNTYSSAAPPVAALFAIMTKVGFYAILRLWTLVFGQGAAEGAVFGQDVMMALGVATIAYGSIGALSCKALDRLASYLIIVSAGTLLLAVAYNEPAVTAGALLYVVVATLAAGALFLLKDVIDQMLPSEAQVLAVSLELYGDEEEEADDDQEVGPTIPAGTAIVGWCFAIAAIVMAGLPPLPGFIAKFAMISGAFQATPAPTAMTWWFTGALMLSGLLVLVAMVRNGINIFWASLPDGEVVQLRRQELAPIIGLLALCVVISLLAGPLMGFFLDAVNVIHGPGVYAGAILPGEAQP
ncbi:monovalent cation/H+ antiporter subunit D [Devosia oryziradicis]|uniref:Monovalent cation/H+ antiporter subunit D n=1 Tax=Devosia oryziradicis TaxID=2801335 RepID=A0ABX7C1T6_9HYPH|nr:monovalent cation/H+ antiporter subunit D [Devosia oryziradicis]QQR36762.1 monovalent cation/H+ antiporter subunit D [Devosia oryziradicis]